MKRLALVLFAAAALTIAGCSSSSTTAPTGGGGNSTPEANSPDGGDMNVGRGSGRPMPTGSALPKIDLPEGDIKLPKGRVPNVPM